MRLDAGTTNRGWHKWRRHNPTAWVTLNPDGKCVCGFGNQGVGVVTAQTPAEAMEDMDAFNKASDSL